MARTPKSLEQARTNYEQSIPNIASRYEQGIANADWQAGAASDVAESNFATAMQKAITNKSRQSGVRKVSNEEWRMRAISKGAAVIGQRVSESLDKWQANFGRVYGNVIRTVQGLRPRTLDANANIDNRVKPVVKAWQDNKLRGR